MVDTLIEKGVVLAVEADRCVVRLEPIDADACRRCGLCAAAADDAEARRILRVPLTRPVSVGERVRIEIRQPNPAVAGLAMFGIPMVASAIGAVVGAMISRLAGWSPAVGAAVGACVALVLGACLTRKVQAYWMARGAFDARLLPQAEPAETAERF